LWEGKNFHTKSGKLAAISAAVLGGLCVLRFCNSQTQVKSLTAEDAKKGIEIAEKHRS